MPYKKEGKIKVESIKLDKKNVEKSKTVHLTVVRLCV